MILYAFTLDKPNYIALNKELDLISLNRKP